MGDNDTGHDRSPSIDADRVEQLEIAIQRLLVKIEQRDGKIKKYEDYYAKQKAKSDERKKSSDPIIGVAETNGAPTSFIPRRPIAAKHPSTSTLETSIQRIHSKNTL